MLMLRAVALIGILFGLAACEDPAFVDFGELGDVFVQRPADAVDLLIVIDDSCSMMDEQQQLAAQFDGFARFFEQAQTDWQIAVVTTDMENGTAGRFVGAPGSQVLDTSTPNPEGAFANLVQVGVYGSPFEAGFDAVDLALGARTESGSNPPFVREEAALTVAFVSDEEDASQIPVNEWLQALSSVKGGASNRFNVVALAGADEETGEAAECGRDENDPNVGAAAGERYIDAARQTDGVVGSICADDFTDIVLEMGLACTRLRAAFPLSREPGEEGISVAVNGVDVLADGAFPWEVILDPPRLRFTDLERLPGPMATIVVLFNEPE
jgi:hypothetical protein